MSLIIKLNVFLNGDQLWNKCTKGFVLIPFNYFVTGKRPVKDEKDDSELDIEKDYDYPLYFDLE